MRKVKMTVEGLVQGVGFRYMTKMIADQIPVYGIVRNNYDGSVYIEANGEDAQMERFIERIRKSPTPAGRVTHLEITDDPNLKTRTTFIITN